MAGFLGTSLRYLSIREEAAFGQPSILNPSVVAYGTFSLRKSMSQSDLAGLGRGSVRRNLQITTPLIRDGRFGVIPDTGDPTVIYPGEAQRLLFDSFLRRKAGAGEGHPLTSKGDLRSYQFEALGANSNESIEVFGSKSTGFQFTTQRQGVSDVIRLAIQYSASIQAGSVWQGDLLPNRLYERSEPGFHRLQSSAIRARPVSAGTVESDLGGSLINDPFALGLSCTRDTPLNASLGDVDASGVMRPQEPVIDSEQWRVDVEAPFWDVNHVHFQSIVSDMNSNSPLSRRYNVRVDMGMNASVMYVELPYAESAATIPGLFGFDPGDFDTTDVLNPQYRARLYGVYAKDVGSVLGDQYEPLPGDTIRHQGYEGPFGQVTETAAWTYVAKIGQARVVDGYLGPRITGGPITFGAGQWIDPDYKVGFWIDPSTEVTSSLTTASEDHYEQWVPGGIAVSLGNVALFGSEGISDDGPMDQASFITDKSSTVEVLY
jgi:hypothetical protein